MCATCDRAREIRKLADGIEAGKPFSFDEVVALLRDYAEALEELVDEAVERDFVD